MSPQTTTTLKALIRSCAQTSIPTLSTHRNHKQTIDQPSRKLRNLSDDLVLTDHWQMFVKLCCGTSGQAGEQHHLCSALPSHSTSTTSFPPHGYSFCCSEKTLLPSCYGNCYCCYYCYSNHPYPIEMSVCAWRLCASMCLYACALVHVRICIPGYM